MTAETHTNKLIHETSPYLLQHAHNPVDWHPWGEEALERARAEDKPIFLSIGYSACHWCHVMEHESFENEEIAAFLNEHFVSVKVDREERPDLDDIYMRATQAMTGAGGWPMTVFLAPSLEPFYAGTYFPPTDRYGRPGFASLISGIARAWQERREDLVSNGQQVAGYLRENAGGVGEGELSFAAMVKATQTFTQSFDEKWGGFGGAPKFPSGPTIELLLREHVRAGSEPLLKMAEHTLHFMYYGGMYDHLGGGFHRYSVDAQWLVPHFEKMLYDNAQLAQAYLEAYQFTGNPMYRRVVEETLAYVLRDMRDNGGAFHSTEDADSEGEEGKFYIWTRSEILEALGEEDGALFCAFYNVRDEGNFSSHEPYHEGQNILHIARPPEATCEEFKLSVDELEQKIDALRAKLLAVRDGRVRPGKDDKILTAWNGLMVSAFARAYQVLGNDDYRRAAEEAAGFVLDTMQPDGVLMRTYREGQARVPGFVDDYANMTLACVDLYEATFDPAWLDRATGLADAMIDRFADSKDGGFFQTVADAPDVIVRMKPTYDGSEPSGNSMAALALLKLARLTGNAAYGDHAEKTLRANAAGITGLPQAFTKMLVALDFYLATPCEVAVAGHTGANDTEALLTTLHGEFLPNKVVALVDPDAHNPAELAQRVPVLLDKTMRDGNATAYVCRNYACQEPVTDPQALRTELGQR